MTRSTLRRRRDAARHNGRIGLVFAAILGLIVYLSYSANSGVPLTSTYKVTVQLPNADRLIRTNEVRIGGIRVGQVDAVDADISRRAPFAIVALKLTPEVGPLPADTVAKVRPASILGSTYVDLILGRQKRTIPNGGTLPLERARPTVEVTDLLNVFAPDARRDLRSALVSVGDGVAGRGTALAQTTRLLAETLGPLSRVSRTLAAPATNLNGLIGAYARVIFPFADESPALKVGVTGAARTIGALAREREAVGATLTAVPPAERATTTALTHLQPALAGVSALVTDLRPAVRRLPGTTLAVRRTLDAGGPALRALPAFSVRLDDALGAVRTLSLRPSTNGALRKLRDTAIAARPTLDVLTPMQVFCNSIGTWAENFSSTFGTLGAGNGPSIANIGVTHIGAENELFQNAKPSSNVGINYLPNQNAAECESGNEPYAGQQLLNNPAGNQPTTHRTTTQPAGVRALGEKAGLIGPTGAGR